MTKFEIIDRIARETTLPKVKASQAVEAVLTVIKGELGSGEPVILRRFGSFQIRRKQPRMGRNPRTGARVQIPARRVVTFRPGKRFKQTVNAGY